MGCLCNELAGPGVEVSPTCIGNLWVFENLQPAEMAALAQAARRKPYKKGQEVFAQGDPANQMFLIKAGRVKLSKITAEGNEITLDIRKAGDFLGESMLIEEADYPLTALCLAETLICGFTRAGFEKLVLEHPQIGLTVIKNLSKRINWLTERVGSLSLTNLEERLYQVLTQVAREHGTESPKGFSIQFPLTHEELGFLVGAHRVSITRAMKALKESGRLLQEGKTLILSPAPADYS
ncbi:MAG: Crp/Fnr family transcriptional regulator [Syntrophobacterales bacterium]|jgi:CRP/FNR family transcriptional regulator|nr:Crp/Fnr family transcriptional regulator [Syntrophobacterales bacterium]